MHKFILTIKNKEDSFFCYMFAKSLKEAFKNASCAVGKDCFLINYTIGTPISETVKQIKCIY